MEFPLEPPPGFQGLRDDLPVTTYQRNLPHWRQDGATYFVTFRLNDSIPAEKQRELRRIRENWESENPPPRDPKQLTEMLRLIGREHEKWLDRGYGKCLLRTPAKRKIAEDALKFFDLKESDSSSEETKDERYELGAFVIMPNHVHGLVRPTQPQEYPLENILRSWKRFTSRTINQEAGEEGSRWFEESFDRIVRDLQHLDRCLQYIGRNPDKADLAEHEYTRWVRPSWRELGWRFRAK